MLDKIVTPLLSWYDRYHRNLPWRAEKNPYYIWISEIMLQQTRVEAVRPYFDRFITALPTVHDLAVCPDDQLLKLWEGLGYYNRARNLKKAAQQIEECYDGALPADYEKLLGLQGIGAYTAGAIASIAWDIPVPAVDGNVLRIWARLTACDEDILKDKVRKRAQNELVKVMPRTRSGDLNQAFMDLGSSLCLPKGQIGCEKCPLVFACEARKRGLTGVLPVRKKPKERRIEERTVLIIRDGERIALHKRPEKGLLAGLYELPGMAGYASETEVLDYIQEKQLLPLYIEPLAEAKHVFSHVEWRMKGYLIRVAALEEQKAGDWLFADTDTVQQQFPLPSAFRAYTSFVNIHLGAGRDQTGQ